MATLERKDYMVVERVSIDAFKVLAFAQRVSKAYELKQKLQRQKVEVEVRFGLEWLSVGDEVAL